MQTQKKRPTCIGRSDFFRCSGLCLSLFGFEREDGDDGTTFTRTEVDGAVNQGVERVVFAHADVVAGVVDSSSLADDDVAGFGKLAAENFYT